MGRFWNSLEREVGKNTGKAISNLVFGDAHSTPYRRTGVGASYPPAKSQRRINAEYLEAQRQAELENLERMLRLQQRIVENEHNERIARERRIEKERIERERKHEQEKFESTKLKEISDKLRMIRGISFSNSVDAHNYLADIVTDIELLDWDIKHAATNKKLILLNESLCDAYLDRYCELLKLSIPLLSNNQRDFHKKNLLLIEKRQASLKGVMNAAKLMAGRLFNTVSEVSQLTELLSERVVENSPETLILPETTVENITSEDSIEVTESICKFIDLNENGRIENILADIWSRYRAKIGKLAERKPIFVSDSPEGSILFVGVNPSFSKEDDSILMHSKDDKSLYYQSLYGEEEVPQYFKMLEAFTKDIGEDIPYAHINLLYAREDNREYLLSKDSNFIREQLELSYDSIALTKPRVIIFFSKYCKDLIFGADRWIDPNSHNEESDSYFLRGLNIPVLFTEDLNILSNIDVDKIEQRVKMVFR